MENKEKESVFTTSEDKYLFKKPFDEWERLEWNEDVPPFFKRLNDLQDERSFVILAASVLEYELDRFLELFIPNCSILVNDRTNLSYKIKIIQAFRLVPPQLIEFAELIRLIRNDFAHNLRIDGFVDAEKSKKLPGHIKRMEVCWRKYEDQMVYYKIEETTLQMFKDIWRKCFEGLRAYESNIKLFRRETENLDFINHLERLAHELKEKREKEEQEKVLKSFMPWRK